MLADVAIWMAPADLIYMLMNDRRYAKFEVSLKSIFAMRGE